MEETLSQIFDIGPSFLGGSLFSVAMVHHIYRDPSPYGRSKK